MMNKNIMAIAVLAALVITAGVVSAVLPTYEVLVAPAYAVMVDTGETLDLPIDTRIGGTPTGEYRVLDEDREFETMGGVKIIDAGEKIWCEAEPGYPDPCGLS